MKNLTPEELAVVAAIDRDRIADDLQALVRVPSLTGDEGAVQTEVALRMATAGLEVERVDVDAGELERDPDHPGREAERATLPLVAGALRGEGPGRVLVAGHVDVVSVGDERQWTTPPWGGELRDGAVYGRGACDMKGGVAAGLAALRALAAAGPLPGEALLVSVPSEEDGGAGMLAAIRLGHTADAAVITEPTELNIVTSHAGAITFRLVVRGRSAHAAFRREGVSAFDKLCLLAAALREDEERRNDEEQLPAMRDLGLPYPTNIGMVSAGGWSSTVPDLAVAEGRYGVRIGQTPGEAEAELRAAIERACSGDAWLSEHPPAVEITGGRFESVSLSHRHPLPWGLGEAARDVLGTLPLFIGVPYGSDMRLLVNHGATPTVLFGPGNPRLAHAPDEHVELEDVARCARVLAVWVRRALERAAVSR
jgi:acetylornithine deacetylase